MKARPGSRLEREALEFLERYGFVWEDEVPDEPHPVVRALKAHLKTGFPAFWRRWGRYESGQVTPAAFYGGIADAKTMAMVMSVAPELAVATMAHVARLLRMRRRLRRGARILDVSTGAGFFPTWLARRHPDVTFVGTDASAALVRAAKGVRRGVGNVSFSVWDHHDAIPRGLGTFDTIVATFAVPLMEERESLRFRFVRDQLTSAFAAWQLAAKPATQLLVISRLPFPRDLEAALHAAHATGWTLEPAVNADVEGGSETIPGLLFSSHLKRGTLESKA